MTKLQNMPRQARANADATAPANSYSTAEVQAIYDKAYVTPGLMGTHFDREYSAMTKRTLLQMCHAAPNPRLLDLGTGDGDLWEYADPARIWHAVDISRVGVERAKRRFARLHPATAIAESLPFADKYFGAVVAADTMEHVFDIDKSLSEVRRILAPGGKFALSVPAPQSLRKWAINRFLRQRPDFMMFFRLVQVVLKRRLLFGKAAFQPIDRDLSLSEWCAALDNNHFEIIKTQKWPAAPLEPIVFLIETRLR